MYKNNCYEYFATIGKSKLKKSQLKHPVAKNNNTCDLGLYWGDPEKLKHFCILGKSGLVNSSQNNNLNIDSFKFTEVDLDIARKSLGLVEDNC